ncbi:MAG: HAMP domain-containing protein [Acidobacteriota bacterium]|nr:HAMP domain-containing protein [Acidobacteriota bacterium]
MRFRLPRRTARLRLTALYGGLFLLSGVALVSGTYVLFERATVYRAPQLPKVPQAPTLAPLPSPQLPQAVYRLTQRLAQDQLRLATLLPKRGFGPPFATPQLAQLARDQRRLTEDQRRLSAAVHQLAQAERQVAQAGSVQAAQRASDAHALLVDSGIALAALGILALAGGWFLAGRMLQPIRTITRTARRISSSSLHERLALDGPQDELKELGDTLDELFARLEAAFEAQRRFVAHASHELRTPITRERALVQVALGDPSTPEVWRSTGEELLASNRRQEALIDGLLALAGSERGLDVVQQADLARILETVLSRPGLATNGSGVRIDAELRPAPVTADVGLVERLAANLVDNAVEHNIAGGRVRVSTGTSEEGGALLTVTNTGPVVPVGEIDRLFQPFQRLDPRRALHERGHGLGLSIVRAVATAHGATIAADPEPDGGLSLRVAFPPATTDG